VFQGAMPLFVSIVYPVSSAASKAFIFYSIKILSIAGKNDNY